MANYRLALLSALAAPANTPLVELVAGNLAMRVREIRATEASASPLRADLALFRTLVVGVSPTTPLAGQPLYPGDAASSGTAASAWGTAPTIASSPALSPFEQDTVGPAVGGGFVWTFRDGDGLYVPAGKSITIWNVSGANVAPQMNIRFAFDE